MKVLFFANTDWYLFHFRLGLAKYLVEKGHEIVMMSPDGSYGTRIEMAGFRWFPLSMDRQSLNLVNELRLLKQIIEIFRAEQPDVVHNFTIKCVVYGSLAARRLGIGRRINAVTGLGHVFVSGSVKARVLRPLVKRLLRLTLRGPKSRLILQNRDDVELFARFDLIDRSMVRLVKGSGVDTGRFSPVTRNPGNRVRVLLASRLLREKGVREYVHAARQLRKRFRSVEFLLAGSPDLGNPSSIQEREIAEWASAGTIQALGHVDDMVALLRTVELVVLPSYREGLPRGLLEAAAMGLPIVTTDVPGCREIVKDGVNGFLVPQKDAKALSTKIEYLLNNPDVCRQYGAAGRKKVLESFDERIVFRKTISVYREVGLVEG